MMLANTASRTKHRAEKVTGNETGPGNLIMPDSWRCRLLVPGFNALGQTSYFGRNKEGLGLVRASLLTRSSVARLEQHVEKR